MLENKTVKLSNCTDAAQFCVSLSGSNGCADQLTNWGGTKKRGLGAPEKKKGDGMSRYYIQR